ncbi:MAG: hypothetical protein ABJF23_32360, partial [Bryobacteraceae bacterium]
QKSSNFRPHQLNNLQPNPKTAARPGGYLDPKGGIMTRKNRQKMARQNGAKAAGTKSPQGIQTSSRNATRHGLLSKVLVLSNESQTKFDDLLSMYMEKFQPRDGVETNLVYEMVAAKWRQQRVWMMETAALELEMDDQQLDVDEHEAKGGDKLNMSVPEQITMGYTKLANNEKTLELLLRYETSYSRMHDRAMREFFRLREKCNPLNHPNPPEIENPDGAKQPPESETYEELPNDPKSNSNHRAIPQEPSRAGLSDTPTPPAEPSPQLLSPGGPGL